MKKTIKVIALVTAMAVALMLSGCGETPATGTQGSDSVGATDVSDETGTTIDVQTAHDFFDTHGGETIDPTQETSVNTEPATTATTTETTYATEPTSGGSNGTDNGSNGTGNSDNGNGGNGGTTSTQPTYATEPDVGPDVSKPKGHWETRVISEAWDETVVDQEAWDEEVKVCVDTQHIQNDTGTDMTGWSNAQCDAWCQSHNCPNHCDDYDSSQPGYCSCNVTIKKVYETQIVHHDAVTHVVHHDAVTEEVWVED